jgi:hypothetical protein
MRNPTGETGAPIAVSDEPIAVSGARTVANASAPTAASAARIAATDVPKCVSGREELTVAERIASGLSGSTGAANGAQTVSIGAASAVQRKSTVAASGVPSVSIAGASAPRVISASAIAIALPTG